MVEVFYTGQKTFLRRISYVYEQTHFVKYVSFFELNEGDFSDKGFEDLWVDLGPGR